MGLVITTSFTQAPEERFINHFIVSDKSSGRILSVGSNGLPARSAISVSTHAGHKAVTLIPSGVNSLYIDSLNPSKPHFDEQYPPVPANPTFADREAILNI